MKLLIMCIHEKYLLPLFPPPYFLAPLPFSLFFNVVKTKKNAEKVSSAPFFLQYVMFAVSITVVCKQSSRQTQKIKYFFALTFSYLFVFCNLTRHQQIYAKSLTFFFFLLSQHMQWCSTISSFCFICLLLASFIFIFYQFHFFPFILQLTLSVKNVFFFLYFTQKSIQGWVVPFVVLR